MAPCMLVRIPAIAAIAILGFSLVRFGYLVIKGQGHRWITLPSFGLIPAAAGILIWGLVQLGYRHHIHGPHLDGSAVRRPLLALVAVFAGGAMTAVERLRGKSIEFAVGWGVATGAFSALLAFFGLVYAAAQHGAFS